ncbi:PhnD/SsuA/transferrin family substrate-binding protein [candidate division CSSED10-310 bacterium]|uniref:PhnD/SsuA/transferrin family substrate-binding protein n=1 Tax=candidate division CSSED10-310 bacterium TaxID=2855610 RepID=A0ABV6Z2S5_UNCC1
MKASKKRIIIRSFAIICFILFSSGSVFSQDTAEQMIFVFFNPDSASNNPIDATNALQTFCNYLNKKEGWNLRAFYFKKQKDLEKFLETHTVMFGILSQIFIVENSEKYNLERLCNPVRNGKTTYRKVIVVKKDNNYKDLEDLRGKKLAATSLGSENMAFYNKVVFRGEIDIRDHFSEIVTVDSASSAIMAVVYKEVDAAAVTHSKFTILQDLNPRVKSQLASIFTSAETPISPLVYFKDNVSPDVVEKVSNQLLSMHNHPLGRNVLLAFQTEAWEKCKREDFLETERILKGYTDTAQSKKISEAVTSTQDSSKPPKPVAEKKPLFQRFQVYQTDDGQKLVFNVWLNTQNRASQISETKLAYSLNKKTSVEQTMTTSGDHQFTISIALPHRESSSEVKEVNYAVKSGDTLGKIATRFLGSPKKYNVIALYNQLKDPNVIYIGQKLRIKSGETQVTEVLYYVTARFANGDEEKSQEKTKFIM